jgi:hypothetical protein
MAFVHGKNTKVLIADADLSGYFRDSTMSANMDMADTSVYGNVYKTYLQGLGEASISLSGLFDGAEDAVDEKLHALIGTDATTAISIAPNGFAVGARVFAMGAAQSSYEISSPVSDVVSLSAAFSSKTNTGGKSGVSLSPLTAVTATANGTAVDNLEATTNGGYGVLHVTAVSGTTPTNTVKIQHSSDNSVWADLVTFTALTTLTTSEVVAVAAGTTVNRYLRAQYTIAGTTPSYTFHVNFARL